jgi:hypothetical protein
MNILGTVAALAAFFSIWFGHVAVRKFEFISPTIWLPTSIFAVLGVFTQYLSLVTDNRFLNTALGILGITLLFDALEFTRQQKRVKRGHAPANPNNPRHAKILEEYSSATTRDLLKRDPIGHVISTEEVIYLIKNL